MGYQNSATGPGLGSYAARSYSLMRPPRTDQRWIRSSVTGVARLRIHPALASKLVTVAGVCRRRGGQAPLDIVLAHLVVGLDDFPLAGLTVAIAMVSSPVPPGAPATAARPRPGPGFTLRPLPASRRPTPGGLRLGPRLCSLTVWPRSGLGEDGREAPPRRGGSCSTVLLTGRSAGAQRPGEDSCPAQMPTITLPSSEKIPVLGQGTWHLAENRARRPSEIAALRYSLDAGMNLIDTAEMYAEILSVRPSPASVSKSSWSARCCRTTRPVRARPGPAGPARGGSARTGWTFTCCTGAGLSRSRRPSRRSWPCRRADGGSATSTSGTWQNCSPCPAATGPDRPGPLQPEPARPRVRAAPYLPGAEHPGHGVLADRAGKDPGPPGAPRHRGPARRLSRPGRPGLGATPGRRLRDPAGQRAGSCGGEPRGARRRAGSR